MGEDAVSMRGISKRFGNVAAVDRMDFHIKKGEIHVLLGENGAGKTTLMKMLYGMIQPDEGEIFINGSLANIRSSKDAIGYGINMVHQHFMLAGYLTVAENVVAGWEPDNTRVFSYKNAVETVRRLGGQYHMEVNPERRVQELSVGNQQRVEILKALYREAEILIMDEPTAVLTPQESDELFNVLRRLKQEGKSIILITHKLKETLQIADRISVLRDGKITAYGIDPEKTDQEELAALMVGRNVELHIQRRSKKIGKTVYQISNLSLGENGGHKLDQIDLSLRKGEILGLAGIEGNGQTELIEVLCGLRKPGTGSLILNGRKMNSQAREFLGNGIGHIPEDRTTRGLVLSMSIEENLMLGYHHQSEFQKWGILRKKNNRLIAERLIKEYGVKARDGRLPVSALSGGNQQKVVIARVLHQDPDVLIAAQPTRGVDVGAMEYIHHMLLELRDKGKAILLISADLDEIRSLSDRIAVIYEGRIVSEKMSDAYTETELGLLMAGGTQ